jgi:hypothetical protein
VMTNTIYALAHELIQKPTYGTAPACGEGCPAAMTPAIQVAALIQL